MWPFKKKPVEMPIADEVRPEEKELPELKWGLGVGPWHKSFRCEHCGHVWTNDAKSHDEDPCPDCGCIGSHKMQVIRYEHEHTQRFTARHGISPSDFIERDIELGRVAYLPGCGLGSAWQGVRNEKTVIWDGCSVKKDANDK